jgi:hypothetical protein
MYCAGYSYGEGGGNEEKLARKRIFLYRKPYDALSHGSREKF